MKKRTVKTVILGITLCCVLLLFSACSQNANAAAASGNATAAGIAASGSVAATNLQTVVDKEIGVSIEMPSDKNSTLVKAFIEPDNFPADSQPKDGVEIYYFAPSFWAGNSSQSAEELQKPLFTVQYYDQAAWDGWIAGGKSISQLTGISTSKEIGRKDGMVYIYSEQAVNEGKLQGQDLEQYRASVKLIPKMRDSIKLIPRAAANMSAFPSISAKDLSGKAVDNSVISGNKLTMINFWATFCGPCVEEMPDLQKMSAQMPEGTKLISIVGDATNDQLISQAQKIAGSKGVTYPNLIPDATLEDYVTKNIVAYPTTIFVDSKGNIIGDAIVGAHNLEFYQSELSSRLKGLDSSSGNTKSTGAAQDAQSDNSQGNDPKVAGPAPATAS